MSAPNVPSPAAMEDLAVEADQLTIESPPSPSALATPSRLDTIAEDVLRLVLAHFVPHGSLQPRDTKYVTKDIASDITVASARELRSSLHALCLTSKSIYAVAIRLLYRTIIFYDHFEMALLFRTLSAATWFRGLVKTFAWVPVRPDQGRSLKSETDDMSEEAKEKMDEIERDIGVYWPATPAEKHCLNQIYDYSKLPWCSEGVLTAVLGMLPHLKTLCVVTGYYQGSDEPGSEVEHDWVADSLWNLLGNDWARKFGFLQELEVFSVHDGSYLDFIGAKKMVVTSHLVCRACPKLRRIESMRNFPRLEFPHRNVTFTLGPHETVSASLEEVVVSFGRSPMAELPRTLRVLPNLKVLRAEYCVRSADTDSTQTAVDWSGGHQTGSWKDTRQALLEAKNTLRELHLTSRRDMAWGGWDGSDHWVHPARVIQPPLLGQVLPHMSALTSLTIEPISLWELHRAAIPETEIHALSRISSLLPPSLETLHLVDYWGAKWRPGMPLQQAKVHYYSIFLGWVIDHPARFWMVVLTGLLHSISENPTMPLKEIKLITPIKNTISKMLRKGERPLSGDVWIDDDPSRSLFSRFEQLGVTLTVEYVKAMTNIPKEEWTYLEAYSP